MHIYARGTHAALINPNAQLAQQSQFETTTTTTNRNGLPPRAPTEKKHWRFGSAMPKCVVCARGALFCRAQGKTGFSAEKHKNHSNRFGTIATCECEISDGCVRSCCICVRMCMRVLVRAFRRAVSHLRTLVKVVYSLGGLKQTERTQHERSCALHACMAALQLVR